MVGPTQTAQAGPCPTPLCILEGRGVPAKSNKNNPLLPQVKKQPWRAVARWLRLNSAAGSYTNRKAASVTWWVRREASTRVRVCSACPGGLRKRHEGGGQAAREPRARAQGCFMEKVLANSTCRVFISPAMAPAAEITTWGKGENTAGPPCPSPAWLGTAGMQANGSPQGSAHPLWSQGCSWAW